MRMKKLAYIGLAFVLLAGCQREVDNLRQDAALSFSIRSAGEAVKSGALQHLLSQEEVTTTAAGDTLRLWASEESLDGACTKASIYTGTTLPEDVSIGFMAYKYETSGAAASAWSLHTSPAVTEAVCDASRGSASSRKWVPAVRLLWPGSGYVKYFAYAPFEAAGATVTAASGAAPSIAYTVPATYDEQVDLLVADAASSCEYEGDPLVTAIDVPLTFNHLLTAIRFRAGKGLSISSVSIKGVYNKGALSLGDATRAWTLDNASKATYTITSPTLKPDPTDSDYSIVNDEYTLILMPQTLPVGAVIEATVTKDSFPKTITAIMEGEVWAPGKLITYTITTEENVVVPVFNVSYGGTTVSSSGTQVDGGKIQMANNDAVTLGFSVTTNQGFTVTSSAPDLTGNNLPSGAASVPETVTPVSISVPFVLAHGQLPGQSSFVEARFHVGSNKEVVFSPGNLQYQASTNTWRFAQHQWDYVGNDKFGTVFTGTEKSNNESISSTYPGWIDLFGWGTSGYDYGPDCYQPYSTSQDRSDYGFSTVTHLTVAAQSDWGVNVSPYRTLSKDEWEYLLDSRGSAGTPRYFLASIQTEPMVFTLTFTAVENPSYSVVYTVERPSWPINGLMVIPDNFENTSLLSSYTLNTLILPKYQEISFSDYFALESAGCVFLPAAGQRDGTGMDWLYNMHRVIGQYWSSTAASNHFAYHLTFEPVTQAWTMYPNHSRMYGMAVRPVADQVEPSGPSPTGLFVVGLDKDSFSSSGGTGNFYVCSSAYTESGSTVTAAKPLMAWRISGYSTDSVNWSAAPPSWLTVEKSSGTGSLFNVANPSQADWDQISFTVAAGSSARQVLVKFEQYDYSANTCYLYITQGGTASSASLKYNYIQGKSNEVQGIDNTVKGQGNRCVGYDNTLQANNCRAAGYSNLCYADGAKAFGRGNRVGGTNSMAVGKGEQVIGSNIGSVNYPDGSINWNNLWNNMNLGDSNWKSFDPWFKSE